MPKPQNSCIKAIREDRNVYDVIFCNGGDTSGSGSHQTILLNSRREIKYMTTILKTGLTICLNIRFQGRNNLALTKAVMLFS